jgi:hypothetical protein
MAACTVLVPANEVQCTTSADCSARGPAFANAVCVANVCRAQGPNPGDAGMGTFDERWGCLAQGAAPSDPTQQVEVQVTVYDAFQPYSFGGSTDGGTDLQLLSYVPQTGATIAACNPLDPTCVVPEVPAQTNDDAGAVTMTLPGSFTGFYVVEKPDYVTSIFYPAARLLAGEPHVGYPVSMVSQANYSLLQQAFGVTANSDTDAGPGLLTVVQYDCHDRRVPGVVVTTNPPGEATVYTNNNIPEKGRTETSGEGLAAILNVPAGSVTVAATLADGGVVSTANIAVRSGRFTLVYLRPRVR